MEKLNEVMVQIKKRPGMFLGKKSLERLSWYLEGYELCRNSAGEGEFKFSEEFQKFVEEKYKIKSYNLKGRISYVKIIMFFSFAQCECTALDRFFELYDEFMEIKLAEKDSLK